MRKTLSLIAILALAGFSAQATTYWLSGAYNSWSTANSDAYAFTDNSDGTHTLTLDEFYGEFKIITSGGGTWYGCTTTTLSLDTEYTLSTSGSNMTLPSSTDTYTNVTFTVTVSGSSITLKVSAGGSTTTATSYYLSGAINSWISSIDSNYTFTSTSTDGVYTLTLSEFYGEFKIVTSPGSAWYGYGTIALDTEYSLSTSGGNITLPSASDTYTNVVFTLTVTSSALILKVTSDGSKTTDMDYYLTGDFNSWAEMSSAYMFTNDGDGVYTLRTPSSGHTTSTGFKIMSSTQLWLGYANGYNIDYDTEYTFSSSGNNTYLNTAPTGDTLVFTLTLANSVYTLKVSQVEATTATTLDLSGEGTESSPYLIATAADWNTLADYITNTSDALTGKYVKVTADLDFSSDTIRTIGLYGDGIYFDGDLNGGGYTLKGIAATRSAATYAGVLFGYVGENAYIHDFTAEGTVTSVKSYSGAIVGYNNGGTFENVTSNFTITASAAYNSGFCGQAAAGSTFISCVNQGDLTSSSAYLAGLVARSREGVTYTKCGNKGTITYTGTTTSVYLGGLTCYTYYCTMTECYNEGTLQLTGTGATCGNVAGLISYAYATAYTDSTVFYLKDCYNTGSITGKRALAGLVTGTSTYVAKCNFYFDGCYNTGTITATGTSGTSSTSCGGIAQFFSLGGTYINCWNSGDITSTAPVYLGGIFGYYAGTASTSRTTLISGCYNTGNITSTATTSCSVGGLFGGLPGYVTVKDCYNLGNVTQDVYYAAGIVGWMNGSAHSKITGCWNAGNISTGTMYAGGIAALNNGRDTIDCCFNVGTIAAGTNYAGGIVGYAYSLITNCYNTGDVSGAKYVGGVCGGAFTKYTSVCNCYNTGTITGDAGGIGSIQGTDISTFTSDNNVFENNYYLTATAPDSAVVDTVSVGLGYAELATLSLGDSWTAGDNYTYPRITAIADNDYAKAYAAAVIPDVESDTYDAMTGVFYLGAPDGVTWVADNSVISYDGQMGYFNASYSGGTITMAAASGNVTVTTTLVYGATTGIDDTLSDSDLAASEIVSETLYNTSGQIVTAPADGQKAIYIVRRVYSDGSVTTAKEAR